jgi:hypothetical protein
MEHQLVRRSKSRKDTKRIVISAKPVNYSASFAEICIEKLKRLFGIHTTSERRRSYRIERKRGAGAE